MKGSDSINSNKNNEPLQAIIIKYTIAFSGVKKFFFILVCILLILNLGCQPRVKKEVQLNDLGVGELTKNELSKELERLASEVLVVPKNADFDNSTWEVTPESQGKHADINTTMEKIMSADEGEKIELIIVHDNPEISMNSVKNAISTIGSFSTSILNREQNRVHNIKIAAEKINYTVISPGEEFSFNGALGKRTEGKGYEPAPIIINKENGPEDAYGVGGGICQISSTLFNAVDNAGLTVTEKHPHSKDVGYVPMGRDATVVYNGADFKFVNNRKYPIMIRISVSSSKVTIWIIENRNIKI